MLKKFFFAFLAFFLGFLIMAAPVLAQETSAVLPQGQTIDEDYFAAGNTVTLAGTVNGDAFLAGGNILVTGTVNGDLLVIGGTVNVGGTVTGNVRAIGGQIIVSGPVSGNVTTVGGATSLTEGARIGGSLVTAGGSTMVLAPVARGLSGAVGQMTIGNTVAGNVRAYVGQLVLAPNARVAGNLTYWSNTEAQVQSGAQIAGTTTRNEPEAVGIGAPRPEVSGAQIQAALTRAALLARLVDLVSALVIGLLLIYAFPFMTQSTVEMIRKEPWKSLGVGLLTLIVTPIIIFILMALFVSIPLALILLAFYLISLYIAKIYVVLWLGELILKRSARGWALLLGLVLYELVTFIPFIGPIIVFFVLLFGLGAIAIWGRNHYRQLRGKNLA
jgi:hypothetical protein